MYTYSKPKERKTTEFTGWMVDEASTIKKFDYSSIYRSKQFNEAMKYFDITDDMTRNILLSVNEADQNTVMISLSNKLYAHIVDKVDDIDFGTIPQSKGDITKIDNYDKLVDCVAVMSDILQAYNQPTDSVEIISIAIQNIADRKDLFMKAYAYNVEMPIIIYNTIVLAIINSISFMISTCIEFIKMPGNEGFDITLNKVAVTKVRDNIVFQDLKRFNDLCAKGDFDKAMEYVIAQSTNKNFMGGATFAFGASGVVLILGLILLIIPIIRELIFFFYYARAKVSEYFEMQSSLLMMNAYNIENNMTKNDKDKKEIANKQKKIADFFKSISNKVKVTTKTAESKTEKDIKTLDDKKYKTSEVLDSVPDSSTSVLF